MSVEFLFSACGDEVSTKFKKCNSNKCLVVNSLFKRTDKIFSSVTHRTYSFINYEKSYVTCNYSNLIFLITCSNCFVQYVRETAQEVNVKFATHRASMNGKIRLNSFNWLAEHFPTEMCKNAKYSVQIIGK